MRWIILLLVLTVFHSIAASTTIHVPDDYIRIQDAINAAGSGDLVLVRSGTYLENIDFQGKALTLRGLDGAMATVLDGGLTGSVVTFSSGEGLDSVLESFTVFNGDGTYDSGYYRGGGIYCRYASPTLTDLIVYGNSVSDNYGNKSYGGGLYMEGGNPAVTGCTFIWNWASYGGGGVYANMSSPTLIDCTVHGNATNHVGGGVCFEYYSHPVLQSCTLNWNHACREGGGFYCEQSNPILTDCTFQGNVAENDNTSIGTGGGMGIYDFSTATVSGCRFVENRSETEGGGADVDGDSSAQFSDCLFEKNASSLGGAIGPLYEQNPVHLTNCLLINNVASIRGGAVHCWDASQSTIVNCTFHGNAAADSGGGLYVLGQGPTVFNSIFWENTPESIDALDLPIRRSCVEGGYLGTGIIDTDPQFVDPSTGDFHLTWTSPCINQGTSDSAPDHDFDGEPRPNMGLVDMGAFEFTGLHPLEIDAFSLSANQGGSVHFSVAAGPENAHRVYLVLGSLDGTLPGIPLPGGMRLPLNWDGFTDLIVNHLNSAIFLDFYGNLDAFGQKTPSLNVPGLNPVWVGESLFFAYTLDEPFDFTSNPVRIDVVP